MVGFRSFSLSVYEITAISKEERPKPIERNSTSSNLQITLYQMQSPASIGIPLLRYRHTEPLIAKMNFTCYLEYQISFRCLLFLRTTANVIL